MSPDDIEKLSEVNQKLGAFPIVRLASGQRVPTGTVATLLLNIRTYDGLVAQKGTSRDGAAEIERQTAQVADEIKAAVPVLLKLGMFELFSVDEWSAGAHPGRNLVGKFAKELEGR